MKETWRDIPGFENYYQVSDKGNVKSLSRKIIDKNGREINLKEKIMKQTIFDSGYKKVGLVSKSGRAKKYFVHRLVLRSFKGENEKIVNHIDGDKLNNHLSNLEYSTYSENLNHAYEIGLRKSATHLYGEEIIKLYKEGKTANFIAEKFETVPSIIKKFFKANSVKIRGPMEAQRKYNIDFKKMVNLIESGMPNIKIAEFFNVPKHTIDQYKSQIKRGRTKF